MIRKASIEIINDLIHESTWDKDTINSSQFDSLISPDLLPGDINLDKVYGIVVKLLVREEYVDGLMHELITI